ncbi:hypothetical protein [Arthrobacter mangrovi]|uniref:Uncharacterized protein n=1 Tax=Arthrobacter mangrovi TaxID=2966350 RepID=A0ABQ5MP66_9MICC|nr:hypothetical protein [Arthrobacter mangrovi]GLB65757.1 hypothetical protein AHIS1636_01960 [Arthrobacter mangrovi]
MTSPSPSKTSEQRRTTPASRLMDGWRHAAERIRETGIGVPLAVLAVIALFWVALRLANYAQQNAISPVEALVRIYGTGAAVLLTLVIAAASVWTIIERLGYTDKFFGPESTGARPQAERPQPVFLEATGTAAVPVVPASRQLPPAPRQHPQATRSPLPVPERAGGAGGTRNDGGVPDVPAPATPAASRRTEPAPVRPEAAASAPARPAAPAAKPASSAGATQSGQRNAAPARPAAQPASTDKPASSGKPAAAGKPDKSNPLAKGKGTKSKSGKPRGRNA